MESTPDSETNLDKNKQAYYRPSITITFDEPPTDEIVYKNNLETYQEDNSYDDSDEQDENEVTRNTVKNQKKIPNVVFDIDEPNDEGIKRTSTKLVQNRQSTFTKPIIKSIGGWGGIREGVQNVQKNHRKSINHAALDEIMARKSFCNYEDATDPNEDKLTGDDKNDKVTLSRNRFESLIETKLARRNSLNKKQIAEALANMQSRESVSHHIHQNFDQHLQINSANIKMFGSAKAIEDENERLRKHKLTSKHILPVFHPYSKLKLTIDWSMVFFILVNVFLLPIQLTFTYTNKPVSMIAEGFWMAETDRVLISTMWFLGIISDIVFTMDIFMNLNTGYIDKTGHVELDIKKIRKNYYRTWFFLDLIATVPFDIVARILIKWLDTLNQISFGKSDINTATNPNGFIQIELLGMLKFFKIFKIMKLLRVQRLMRQLKQLETLLELGYENLASVTSFIKNILCILIVINWMSCFQYGIPYAVYGQQLPENSWIVVDGYEPPPKGNHSILETYLQCQFRSWSQIMMIGYGQTPVENQTDMLVVVGTMIVGALLFSVFIGLISSMVKSSAASERNYTEKVMHVSEYLQFRRVPFQLKKRIDDYYIHRFESKAFNEDQILSEMSPLLKTEICNYNCRGLLKNIPLLSHCTNEMLDWLAQRMEFESYLSGDLLSAPEEKSRGLYMIARGTVRVRSDEFLHIEQLLTDGDYFNELELILPHLERSCSIVAVTSVHLYLFSHDTLEFMMTTFPEFRERFKNGFLSYTTTMEKELKTLQLKLADIMEQHEEESETENESRLSSVSNQNKRTSIGGMSKANPKPHEISFRKV